MFLDEKGEKISKSAGNGISIDEWLSYASAESLSYFMYQKPRTAKRLHFDVIPKAMDEYDAQVRAYHEQSDDERMNNPVYHIHGGDVPESQQVVPYSMLLNLAGVALTGDEGSGILMHELKAEKPDASAKELAETAIYLTKYKQVMWSFIRKYSEKILREAGTNPVRLDAARRIASKTLADWPVVMATTRLSKDLPELDKTIEFAINYFQVFIKPNRVYRLPDDKERKAMEELVSALRDGEKAKEIIARKIIMVGKGDAPDNWSPDNEGNLKTLLYAIGTIRGFDPMRDWFKALYEVLLGTSDGPPFGGFIDTYGADETADLIEKALEK